MKAYLVEYLKNSSIWNKVEELEIDCNVAHSMIEVFKFKRIQDRDSNEVYFKRTAYDCCEEIIFKK